MLKNYFLIAYRNLLRNKEYSFINILGLAISIASCLVLYYMLRYELSFDTFHTNKKHIYRVVTQTNYAEGIEYEDGVPAPLPEAMRLDVPQIKKLTVILSNPNSQIDVADDRQPRHETKFREERGVFFAEPEFFEIFDFEWLHGSPDQSLAEPNTVILTQETAEKYFGDWKNAIGKTVQYNNTNLLKVTGILKNIPANSDFPLKVVISYKTREENTNWGSVTNRRQCYVLLDEHTSPKQIQNLFPSFEKKYHEEEDNTDHYSLQPLKDIHFDVRFGNFSRRTISRTTLLSLGMIGLFLMITAAINFVNLAIAQVIKKSKEVGVRKVLGSSRMQLSLQFYGETFLLLVIASCLALVIAEIALPFLRPLLNLPVNFNAVSAIETGSFLVLVSFSITVLSGFYPASVMGGFKPVQALKSKISNQTIGGLSLRKSLVVVQFVIAQILVIVTLVVLQQLRYFRNAPLGFNEDSVLLFSIPTDSLSQTKIESLRSTLLLQPETTGVSFSFTAPLSGSNRSASFQFDNSGEQTPFQANLKYADTEFFNIYDLSLVAGRIYQSSDTAREYVVNKTFLEKLGIKNSEDGIGKVITLNGTTLPIVGVVNDFHLQSLQEKIEPMIMMCSRNQYRSAGIKIDPRKTKEAIAKIEKIYAGFFPDNIFEYKFLDEDIARQYADEERLSSLINILSCVAIFISCLGLYGLISFMAVQRTKEVGVRKVLGATVGDILILFNKEFILLILVAFTVSGPVAWYFMSDWLDQFAYRIDLTAWIFIIAIVLSLIVAMITVSFQSIKAALANPVNSLRNE
jgi:ABC-type antimicrobial peptide transport system permease subunit